MVVLVAIALGAAAWPLDGAVSSFARRLGDGGDLRLGGDVRMTIATLQQFGDLTTSIIAMTVVYLLDRARRGRLVDWIAGAGATWAVVQGVKILVGRPRPELGEPGRLIGPFRAYPLRSSGGSGVETVSRHSWEFWHRATSELWSMPSSHTAAAVAMGVALTRLYPALRPLVVVLVCVVGAGRLIFGAHYASDLLVGAGIGYAMASLAMDHRWGGRLAGRRAGA